MISGHSAPGVYFGSVFHGKLDSLPIKYKEEEHEYDSAYRYV